MDVLLLCLAICGTLVSGVWLKESVQYNNDERGISEDGTKLQVDIVEEMVKKAVDDKWANIISELRKELSWQGRRIKSLENRDRRMNTVVNKLDTRVTKLESKMNKWSKLRFYSGQRMEGETVDAFQTEETKTFGAFDRKLDGQPGAQNRIQKPTDGKVGTRSLKARQQAATRYVAFSAYLDHEITSMGIGHTIKMNKVLLNDGNGYNPHTGVFSAPVSGVYMFIYHFMNYDTNTYVRLVMDDVEEVEAAAIHNDGDYHDNASNSVILRVAAGQSVWLEVAERNGGTVESNPTERFCTFSGVLLY